MLITVDTTHPSYGIQLKIISPRGQGNPLPGWTFACLMLMESLFKSVKFSVTLIPAILYIYAMLVYWPDLNKAGLSIWEAGTGLVALYGLGLHWWRTSTQSKLYEVELRKSYRS